MKEELPDAGRVASEGTGSLTGSRRPVPLFRCRRVFPGDAGELGVMRRWVMSMLPGCSARDDVVLIATELASNAICHTASGRGGWFAVEVRGYRAWLRVAVTDGGAPQEPRIISDPAGERRRGLLVVSALSVRAGVRGDDRGRSVWADVACDDLTSWSLPASTSASGHGISAWFGERTRQWWALVHGELVEASSPAELAALVSQVAGRPPRCPEGQASGKPGPGHAR